MAVSYIQQQSAQRGFTASETGIHIETLEQRFENPYEWLFDETNRETGFAYDMSPKCLTAVSGETSTGGVLADTFGAAVTLDTDESSGFGVTLGDQFMTGAALSSGRAAWKSFSGDYISIEGLTAV